MALNLNQQSISAKAGEGVYAPYPARTFKLDTDLAAPCGPTTACKLAGKSSNGLPVVTPITDASADVVYCVIAYDLRNNSFDAGDKVKGWVADEVIWLTAKEDVTAGAKVSAELDGTVKSGGDKVLGIAESSASAGALVAVRLTSPYAVA
jgi:hypothetical protein